MKVPLCPRQDFLLKKKSIPCFEDVNMKNVETEQNKAAWFYVMQVSHLFTAMLETEPSQQLLDGALQRVVQTIMVIRGEACRLG